MNLEEMTREQLVEYAERLREGTEARLAGAFKDEAALERAQLSVLKSEEKYRRLFEHSPVGIISVDANGRIEEVNPTLLGILGSPSAEATKSINMFEFPPLVKAGIGALFRSCIQTGVRLVEEIPYTSKWGVTAHLRFTLSPLKDEHGRVMGCEAVVEDVSDRKRLEAHLLHSRKMEAIGTFAGGVAHEFNNLLHIIAGHAELLELELDERNLPFDELSNIRKAAQRGAELVQGLLAYGRKAHSTREPLDLNPLIERISQMLSLPCWISHYLV